MDRLLQAVFKFTLHEKKK